MTRSPARRRLALQFARAGTAFSAAMLVIAVISAWSAQRPVDAAAGLTPAGTVRFFAATPDGAEIVGGGSGLSFNMQPPTGAVCSGTAAGTPSYRWQTFIVPSTVDIGALSFTTGPVVAGGAFAHSLYEAETQSAVENKNPALVPIGQITGIPTISFQVFAGEFAPPAGTYAVGFACTADGKTEKFWSAVITVTLDANDQPAGFTWAVGTGNGSTTTTSTTVGSTTTTTSPTTTTAPTTTTTIRSTTTSTTVSVTTTTVGTTSTSTSTTLSGATTSTSVASAAVFPSSASSGSTGTSGGSLPSTGWSPTHLLVWAALLLICGRATILLGRPVTVREQSAR